MALIGLVAATFALPQLLVFAHGFVLSALPATDARAAAAFAVVCGIVVAIVGIPATIQVFNTPPTIDTQGLHQAQQQSSQHLRTVARDIDEQGGAER